MATARKFDRIALAAVDPWLTPAIEGTRPLPSVAISGVLVQPSQTLLEWAPLPRSPYRWLWLYGPRVREVSPRANVAGHLPTSGMAVPNQFVGGERYPSE